MQAATDAFADPDISYITSGNYHIGLGEFEAAIADYDKALALRDSPQAHWNRSKALLALGRYREGFQDYQARFGLMANGGMSHSSARVLDTVPRWRHQKIAGKHIILLHEGGFGDTLMLLRYVPMLLEMGASVAIDVPHPLQAFVSRVAPLTTGFGDLCAPFFDLPLNLGTTPETIPVTGYFLPDPEHCKRWGEKLDTYGRGFAQFHPKPEGPRKRVGVCWSSMYRAPERSLPLQTLLDLLDHVDGTGDCDFVSLQLHDAPEAQAAAVWTPTFTDFHDVAAAMVHLDAIISIDSAPLHLAGSIGHPNVIGLLPYVPEWRWLAPWYPDIKFVRQETPGDWPSAFAQI